jgi:hypothetical protein
MDATSIRYNMITANQVGVVARYELLFPVSRVAISSAFDHNNVVGNVQQNFRLVSGLNHAVPDNWWGTTDPAAIDAGIVDGHDQPGLGIVSYQPILNGPADVAGRLPPTFTPTPTRIPTATPTPTPPPAGRAACEPRPRVDVTTAPDGTGRLRVTIAARTLPGAAAAPPNRLIRVTIGPAVNAAVEAGQPPAPIISSLELPTRPTSATLWVRRLDPNAATTVRLLIDDDCGQWPTFVGGGPGSF